MGCPGASVKIPFAWAAIPSWMIGPFGAAAAGTSIRTSSARVGGLLKFQLAAVLQNLLRPAPVHWMSSALLMDAVNKTRAVRKSSFLHMIILLHREL
ncbi:MAG: hypothetical protein A2Z25_20215 [Planctomycetes bacterium RBG_16_55_9]|nr:MAG: hypothetical protein A2Z25_20215 [Planctomycetes bacterium RBG_16_55_9]